MSDSIEPLIPRLWFERIERIAQGHLGSVENALRHALHLLQLTPLEFRPSECAAIDEDAYETLLASGEFEQAARCLVSAPTLSVTACSARDQARVGVQCSTLNQTFFGEGPTVADAILQVWSDYLLMLRTDGCGSWLKVAEQG